MNTTPTKLQPDQSIAYFWGRFTAQVKVERPLLSHWVAAVCEVELLEQYTPAVLVLTFSKRDEHAMNGMMRPAVRQFLEDTAVAIMSKPTTIVGVLKSKKTLEATVRITGKSVQKLQQS